MIKVCHITTVHPTFDGRIFHKECVSLAKAGFDVSIVVTHPKDEIIDGVKVHGIRKSKGRLGRVLIMPWKALFKALRTKSKIYHIHDPELMFLGLCLKILGKKVIFDFHELVYQQILTKKWLGNGITIKMVANIYRVIEYVSVLSFDKLVLAETGYIPYFRDNYEKQFEKTVVLRNYPLLRMIDESKEIDKDDSIFKIVYAGSLTNLRGIKELCEAVQLVEYPVELILLGSWENDSFEGECLNNKTRINYIGRVPHEEVFSIMKGADVGLGNLYNVKNHTTSLLTKGYEYMGCGLPMILSNFPLWVNEFEGYSLFVEPTSVFEIKDAICWMIENESKRLEMGHAGKKMVKEKYSWEEESKSLIKMYESLV